MTEERKYYKADQTTAYIIGVIAILFGVILGLFGRKVYKIFVFFISYSIFFDLTISLLKFTNVKENTSVWIGLIVGLIFAILAVIIDSFGKGVLGLSVGFCFAQIIVNMAKLEKTLTINLISIGCMVAGLILIIALESIAVEICTAIYGSYVIACGVDMFIRSGFNFYIKAEKTGSIWKYGFLAGFGILSVLCFMFQIYFLNKPSDIKTPR